METSRKKRWHSSGKSDTHTARAAFCGTVEAGMLTDREREAAATL
jgi:hypothetical protein